MLKVKVTRLAVDYIYKYKIIRHTMIIMIIYILNNMIISGPHDVIFIMNACPNDPSAFPNTTKMTPWGPLIIMLFKVYIA